MINIRYINKFFSHLFFLIIIYLLNYHSSIKLNLYIVGLLYKLSDSYLSIIIYLIFTIVFIILLFMKSFIPELFKIVADYIITKGLEIMNKYIN